MEIVTSDLSKFGYRELKMASELLNAYLEQGAEFLGDGLTLNFNTHSGYVFLSDEDYKVAMLNNGRLEEWFYCPECGNEGFKDDGFCEEGYCRECHKEKKCGCTRISLTLKELGGKSL